MDYNIILLPLLTLLKNNTLLLKTQQSKLLIPEKISFYLEKQQQVKHTLVKNYGPFLKIMIIPYYHHHISVMMIIPINFYNHLTKIKNPKNIFLNGLLLLQSLNVLLHHLNIHRLCLLT